MMAPERIRSWVYRAAIKNQDKAAGLQKGVDFKLSASRAPGIAPLMYCPEKPSQIPLAQVLQWPSPFVLPNPCTVPCQPVLHPRLPTSGDCAHTVLRTLGFLLVWDNSRDQQLTRGCGDREKEVCMPGPEAPDAGSGAPFFPWPLRPWGQQWLPALLVPVLHHPSCFSLNHSTLVNGPSSTECPSVTPFECLVCLLEDSDAVVFFSLCLQLIEAGSYEGKISAFDEYRGW